MRQKGHLKSVDQGASNDYVLSVPKIWPAIVVTAVLAGMTACSQSADPSYGEPVRYALGREVVFPDFSIRYLGERHVKSAIFKPGFIYYDFEVTSGSESRKVSWSSGTGVIDSSSFEIGGKPYELELRGTVARRKWLKDDEMILWPREAYLRAARGAGAAD